MRKRWEKVSFFLQFGHRFSGVYKYKDGRKYEGDFQDDKFNGKGKHFNAYLKILAGNRRFHFP